MKASDFSLILEKICSLSLAPFEFNGFLNKFDSRKEVRSLAFTLGLSQASVKEAVKMKADILVAHNAPESLSLKDLYYREILKIAENSKLGIYRLHLPLDFAEDGIIDQLCRMMKFKARPVNLTYGGYVIKGGVYLAKESLSLEEVIRRVQIIRPSSLRIVSSEKEEVEVVAITSGDGCKPEFLIQLKPDVFICGLLNQEAIRIANDLNIILIEATSYATENGPLKRFVRQKKEQFSPLAINFIDLEDKLKNYNLNNKI